MSELRSPTLAASDEDEDLKSDYDWSDLLIVPDSQTISNVSVL